MLYDEKPTLEDLILQHHGVKGMRWGQRKEEPVADARSRARKAGGFVVRSITKEPTNTAAVIGLVGVGVAFSRSPRAQQMLKVPTSAAVHYLAKPENQRKVFRAAKKTGIFISKL